MNSSKKLRFVTTILWVFCWFTLFAEFSGVIAGILLLLRASGSAWLILLSILGGLLVMFFTFFGYMMVIGILQAFADIVDNTNQIKTHAGDTVDNTYEIYSAMNARMDALQRSIDKYLVQIDYTVSRINDQVGLGGSSGDSAWKAPAQPAAPAQNYQHAPAQNYQHAPAQNYQHAPAQNYQQAPVQNYQQAPAQNYPQAPAQNRPQAPAQNRPQAPAQNNPQAPVQNRPQAPAQNNPQAPAQNRPQAPAPSNPQTPAPSSAHVPVKPAPQTPPADHAPDVKPE